jgi:hypothetical protein
MYNIMCHIKGTSQVIMNPTDLKMQPTKHLESKPEYFPRSCPGLLSKCIVGCLFNAIGLIITYKLSACKDVFSEN